MDKQAEKIKILFIDSDEMMRIYFRDIFWVHGRSNEYEIMTASSLEEAEKIIFDKNTCPDIIFLDIMTSSKKNHVSAFEMARCVEFVSKIKNNKEFSKIKMILHSGYKEDSLKDNLLKNGIGDFLIKGESTPKEIIDYIDKINGNKHNN